MRRLSNALVAGLALAAGLTGCGSTESTQDRTVGGRPHFGAEPERSIEAKSVSSFDSLEAMAAGSDLVVRGRVVKVEPGRAVGHDPGSRFYFREITVEVLETALGEIDPRTVVLEEEGYENDGTGYVLNGIQWSAVDDEGWFFLHRKDDGGAYRLSSSHGRYLLTGDHPGASGFEDDEHNPWAPHRDADTAPEIDALVTRAVEAVR